MGPLIAGFAVLAAASIPPCGAARDPAAVNPPFPRIGTCYGAGLGWKQWEQGKDWWRKLSLIVGGCYDLHYDWDNPRWKRVLWRLEKNLAKLHQANPHCLVLPYVDVVEGPDNPAIPEDWWDLRDGKRWSGWPGYYRINTRLPTVLRFNLDKVRDNILARSMFDGVFYDCWHPDDWLVPRTAGLRGGRAIVMINDWNLPTSGFEFLNGCLAEDELNRVEAGDVDFEDFLSRYLRWCSDSRRPVTTMLVCHPRTVPEDPWTNAKRTRRERLALKEKARTADPQMLRFGLATTLMGDGYFAYDGGNGLSRGNWWWYPEYDAPLGYPKGPAHRSDDGLWRREFTGGTVVVNGTVYDATVHLPSNCRDASTGRVGTRFTIPLFDGRIFLPTDAAATPGKDKPPRLTRRLPKSVQVVRVGDDLVAVRTPGGLEARFRRTGELRRILLRGDPLVTGGWPTICARPRRPFFPVTAVEPRLVTAPRKAVLVFRGRLEEGGKRIDYTETATLEQEQKLTLRYEFSVLDDVDVGMWRHYFAFPVSRYAGGHVEAEGRRLTLPKTLGAASLLPPAKQVAVQTSNTRVVVTSTVPLGLADHRRWHREEYLLAGYPLRGRVPAGTKLTVEMILRVRG